MCIRDRFFRQKKWAFWTFFGWRLAAGAFFGPNSVSPGKEQFSSVGGLPQSLFLAKNDGFGGKMPFLRFIRDVNNPIGSLFQFFGSIRPFPKKYLVLSLFSKNLRKIFKKDIFLEMFIFH